MLLAMIHSLMLGVAGMFGMVRLLADGGKSDGKRESGNQYFHVSLR
jgi:hypothetical protein